MLSHEPMRILIAISSGLALLACVVAGAAARPSELSALHVTACRLGPTTHARGATFYAQMHALPGTGEMAMRFNLYQHPSRGAPLLVKSPALAVWRKSRASVANFAYAQTVQGLGAGGTYTMSVEFRWLDAQGHVIKRAERSSGPCSEVGPLTSVHVTGLSAIRADTPGSEVYEIDLRNSGTVAVRSTGVALHVDRGAVERGRVDLIQPGETARVELTGGSCENRVRVVLQRLTFPRQETVLAFACPALR